MLRFNVAELGGGREEEQRMGKRGATVRVASILIWRANRESRVAVLILT